MKCTEFETVVNELLDLRLDLKTDMRISAHVATCESCKEELMIYESLATIEPPATQGASEPASRTENQVESASAIRTRQAIDQKRLGYVVLTAAVALFLVLGPLSDYFFVQNSRPDNVAKALQDERSAPSDSVSDSTDGSDQSPNAIGQNNSSVSADEDSLKESSVAKDGSNAATVAASDSGHSDSGHSGPGNSSGKNSGSEKSNAADRNFPPAKPSRIDGSGFWASNALPPMQDPFGKFDGAYQRIPETPDLDDLERVGESLETVWKTIQEDDYILPLVKQGALLLVRGS